MPISLDKNLNSKQNFRGNSGLSSLNAAYLQTPAQASVSVSAQNNTQQNQPQAPVSAAPANMVQPQTSQILNPNQAYMPGVGAVPSGYFLPGEEAHGNEDHIIKKTPLTGARIMADKISKDIFVYAPKGMQGSKNSNFYEYLSLGILPYIVGSMGLIATSVLASKSFNPNDAKASKMMYRNVAGGVVLYAIMKWLGQKAVNVGTKALTGVDMEMPYKKVVSELPENGQERVVTEFHRVFESVDFPRWDLINKQGEANGNRYEYYDKIAARLGCDQPLNAPDQAVQPLIRQVLTKAMAARSISSFLWAATGVAIAAQKPFSEFMGYTKRLKGAKGVFKAVKDFPAHFAKTFTDSVKQLWKGSTASAGAVGKLLIVASAASTILGILNTRRGFSIDTNSASKSKIDYKKDYVEN